MYAPSMIHPKGGLRLREVQGEQALPAMGKRDHCHVAAHCQFYLGRLMAAELLKLSIRREFPTRPCSPSSDSSSTPGYSRAAQTMRWTYAWKSGVQGIGSMFFYTNTSRHISQMRYCSVALVGTSGTACLHHRAIEVAHTMFHIFFCGIESHVPSD